MERLPFARSYRDLVVYRRQRELAQAVFAASKGFPAEEKYSLTDQVRRSSRSIGAQIAEAWAKRRYPKHFVAKLTDANGEREETHHWIATAHDCAYLDDTEVKHLLGQC
jgi:four helix bundle protein